MSNALDVIMRCILQVEHIQDQEWLESIRDSYQPAQIDEGLWIIPSWCQPEDASAVNITLEPGIAFGTGDHPTTRLCLKALLSLDLRGKTVMDYGTGMEESWVMAYPCNVHPEITEWMTLKLLGISYWSLGLPRLETAQLPGLTCKHWSVLTSEGRL